MSYNVPAVERALKILKFLKRKENRQSSLAKITSALEVNKSTCFSILQTLVNGRMVHYNQDTKTYQLGWALPELGWTLIEDTNYVTHAQTILQPLVQHTGWTCHIWQRVSVDRVILLYKIEAASQLRLSVSLGARFPIYVGAMGRSFMAFLNDEERSEIYARGLRMFTARSIVEPAIYEQELQLVRARGFAEDSDGYQLGVSAVGAPVFNNKGEVLFATSLVLITPSPTSQLICLGEELRSACESITRILGGNIPKEYRYAQVMRETDLSAVEERGN